MEIGVMEICNGMTLPSHRRIECLLPRKHGFSECMGVMPCHPYIQRGYRPFVIIILLTEVPDH